MVSPDALVQRHEVVESPGGRKAAGCVGYTCQDSSQRYGKEKAKLSEKDVLENYLYL